MSTLALQLLFDGWVEEINPLHAFRTWTSLNRRVNREESTDESLEQLITKDICRPCTTCGNVPMPPSYPKIPGKIGPHQLWPSILAAHLWLLGSKVTNLMTLYLCYCHTIFFVAFTINVKQWVFFYHKCHILAGLQFTLGHLVGSSVSNHYWTNDKINTPIIIFLY